jgi:signal transduction histidine kinase
VVQHARVETAAQLTTALDGQSWDLILSDYSLPTLDAPRALEIVRDHHPDLPFIIVSGTVDEITAVSAMRAGANDFIAKGKLARLLPAIEREMREAANRRERRQMREQLLVSDRLASLGTLAAGVAHEINNPLAAVVGNIDVALMLLGNDGGNGPSLQSVAEILREAREAAMQVCNVSRDLKVFTRGSEEALRPIDVRRVLDSSLRLAHNETRHRARVTRHYDDIPPVAANETRLAQVFLNLVMNAAHAIPDGAAQQHEIRVVARRARADRVVVEVSDTGCGIPEDVLPHVFDLFFTTKPVGEGTGLGLAICQRIVGEHGGEITVESRVAEGTTFRIWLPSTGEPDGDSMAGPQLVPQITRRGRILVIDDDERVLNVTRRILAPHHDVVTTTSARQGLDLILAGEEFDLVFCDVLMPNMTGRVFHEELEARAPEHAARVVFITGGAFTADARAFLSSVGHPRLDKPFDASTLLELVERLLRRDAAP